MLRPSLIAVLLCLSLTPAVQSAVYPGRNLTASKGNQRGLYMAIRADTAPALSQTGIDAIRASELATRTFYAQNSGGQVDMKYDVVDVPISLVLDNRDNQLHRPDNFWDLAENYVRTAYGLEPNNYQLNLFDVSATPPDIGQGWSGIATFPGNNLAMQAAPGDGWGQLVIDHELGHRVGAPHSSAWRLTDNSNFNPYVWDVERNDYVQYSPAAHGVVGTAYGVELDEYGDPLSVMGNISRQPFSVHHKLTKMSWLAPSQVPTVDTLGDGVQRLYAHDTLQATLNETANVMGVVAGYNPNVLYGLQFQRTDEVFNKSTGLYETRNNTYTLEYRDAYNSVYMYLNDGLLDLDLAGGTDRNHIERGLQVGDRIEDATISSSYFIGTGANNEWGTLSAPNPTPSHVLRPERYEFRVLAAGSDMIGSYVDVAIETIEYVPRGDLNDDGFFDECDSSTLSDSGGSPIMVPLGGPKHGYAGYPHQA